MSVRSVPAIVLPGDGPKDPRKLALPLIFYNPDGTPFDFGGGAQGPQGPPGADGADGADGAPGAQGAQGIQGPQGPVGPSTIPAWAPGTNYAAGAPVMVGGGMWTRNAAGVSRATFDATEQATWTMVPGFMSDTISPFDPGAGVWDNTGIGGADGGIQNLTGWRIFVTIRAGVVSNPGQNGHIYLDVAQGVNGGARPTQSNAAWKTVDYVACRNNQAAGTGTPGGVSADGLLGMGKGLQAFVPKYGWFRLRKFVVPNYTAPTYITDGAIPGSYMTLS